LPPPRRTTKYWKRQSLTCREARMSTSNDHSTIYFGGKEGGPKWKSFEERVWTPVALLHYVATIWVNRNEVPTEPPALTEFDVWKLWPEYRAFIESGQRCPERGGSLEELFLMLQLRIAAPITCLLNSDQPEQPIARITRLRRLRAREIWSELQLYYANPKLHRPNPDRPMGVAPIQTLVYDGTRVAHGILSLMIWDNELHFQDSWPEVSLLCAENNSAGVAAQKSNLATNSWRISADEFQRVVFAAFLPPPRLMFDAEDQRLADMDHKINEVLRAVNKPGRSIRDIVPSAKAIGRLESAALSGRMWEVKVALNKGDDVNAQGVFGTPLHAAARNGQEKIVELLVRYGADHRLRDANGKTAIELAAAGGHVAIEEYLRSLG